MIEDIEGAATEPARRWHVVALSGAGAIVSLVLLLSLITPAAPGTLPQAASPAPSADASPAATTIVTGPTMFISTGPPYFVSRTILPPGVNVKLVSECADGTKINPPYYLVFEGNGQVIAVPLDARTAASPQIASVDRGSGWLTVSCATSTFRVPRSDRRR